MVKITADHHLHLQAAAGSGDGGGDVVQLSEGRGMCNICGAVHKTLAATRSHVKKIHLSGSIECTLCGRVVRNTQCFAMHLLRRHQLRGMQTAMGEYGKPVAAARPAHTHVDAVGFDFPSEDQ